MIAPAEGDGDGAGGQDPPDGEKIKKMLERAGGIGPADLPGPMRAKSVF